MNETKCVYSKVHKNDFILHIKNSRMLKDFEVPDPKSEFHWKKKADLAFRYKRLKKTKKNNFLIADILVFLTQTVMDISAKKSLNG